MERENVNKCKHVADHSCGFQGEPDIEDCLFCLPTSAITSYRRALMRLGEETELPFSEAYMVYVHADSASQKSNKFAKLMEKHHPDIYKRNTPKTFAIIIGPNPILEENPLAR